MPIQRVKNRNGYQVRNDYNKQPVVVWLGKATKEQAIQFERQMQTLVLCKASGAVLDADTAKWLGGLSDDRHHRIAEQGLVSAREPRERGISWPEAVPESQRSGTPQKRWPAHQTSRESIKKLIRQAGYEPWPKVLHNLRKNRATELLSEYLPQSVASWLGHDVKVLLDYSAIIKSEDFASARDFRA